MMKTIARLLLMATLAGQSVAVAAEVQPVTGLASNRMALGLSTTRAVTAPCAATSGSGVSCATADGASDLRAKDGSWAVLLAALAAAGAGLGIALSGHHSSGSPTSP